MDAEEGPAADLAAGHAHRGGGDGSVVGREEPLLPALAPQFGERRAIALQPGGEHQAEDEQRDQQRVHFAAALHPLPVGAAQPVPDRSQDVRPQRCELAPAAGRGGPAGPRRSLAAARERPLAQQLAEIRSQRPGPDLLGSLRRLAAAGLAARCPAQQLPARRLVAGPGMLLRVHIRFQQDRARSMELVPVGWQLSRRQRQRVRGKILHLHPGQHKKPRIAHHQLQMGVVGLVLPADPLVPAGQPPRGGVEQQAAEQALAAVAQEVGHIAAQRLAVAERVVALDPLLPLGESRPVRHGVQPQRPQAGEIGGDWRLGGRAVRESDRPVRAARAGLLGRQRDDAMRGELLEEARGEAHAAGARAGLPAQVLADGLGEFGAAQPGAGLHHFLHVGDLPASEALAEECRGREALNARVNRWVCCHPKTASQNAVSMSTPLTNKFLRWCNPR